MQSPFLFPGSQPLAVSPPPAHGAPGMFAATGTPPWATQIMDKLKQIKEKVSKIDKLEKTVNHMKTKVVDLETTVKALETKSNDMEKARIIFSNFTDTFKKELDSTSHKTSALDKQCKLLNENLRKMSQEKSKMEEKLLNMERKSMEQNLIFYGIPETPSANCEEKIKLQVLAFVLGEDSPLQPADVTFEWVNRAGRSSPDKIRPIIARLTDFKTREVIRQAAYERKDALKEKDLGVGIQLPFEMRERRRRLTPTLERLRSEGRRVKFVGDKLFVDGRPYSEPDMDSTPAQPRQDSGR